MRKKENIKKVGGKEYPLVKVKWADHYIDYGDHDIKDVQENAKDAFTGSYAGYLVAKSRRMVVIASNVWEDGTVSDPMYIMRRAILEYKEYRDE